MSKLIKTSDLLDKYDNAVRVAEGNIFRDFGKRRSFSGKIVTVKCFEDNPLIRKMLEQPGEGRVLVVDGRASMNCALLGDTMAAIAVRNRWEGIVINGCVRDSSELSQLDIGIRGLGTNPRKSGKKGEGEINVNVAFAGVTFIPGEHIYCDEDGMILSFYDLAV
jgi:regulator of ribonuclease activity A